MTNNGIWRAEISDEYAKNPIQRHSVHWCFLKKVYAKNNAANSSAMKYSIGSDEKTGDWYSLMYFVIQLSPKTCRMWRCNWMPLGLSSDAIPHSAAAMA